MMALHTDHSQHITAHCPSCDTDAEFDYTGRQNWPAKLLKHRKDAPPYYDLWSCCNCGTTVSEQSLEDDTSIS